MTDLRKAAEQDTAPPKREWFGLTDEEQLYYLQVASNVILVLQLIAPILFFLALSKPN